MNFTFHLDFDPYNAEHRQVAAWLSSQSDPAEAIVRLIRVASEGERRLTQWEELANLLAEEIGKVRHQMGVASPSKKQEARKPREVREDPVSAQRLDSMFR
jgi:hypothetical protein